MHLSNKLTIFFQIFTKFVKYTFCFEHFEKKHSLIAYVFAKL